MENYTVIKILERNLETKLKSYSSLKWIELAAQHFSPPPLFLFWLIIYFLHGPHTDNKQEEPLKGKWPASYQISVQLFVLPAFFAFLSNWSLHSKICFVFLHNGPRLQNSQKYKTISPSLLTINSVRSIQQKVPTTQTYES